MPDLWRTMAAVDTAWLWVFVLGVLGVLVGGGELASRYRDAPVRALWTRPGALYLLVNGLAAITALSFLRVFGWNFTAAAPTGTAEATGGAVDNAATRAALTQILVAGFAAITLLRSSLTIQLGEKDVSIGPSGVLRVLLDATDREVDRLIAQRRDAAIGALGQDITFTAASTALPAYCMVLMQNVTPEEQQEIGRQVTSLSEAQMSDRIKKRLLMLYLLCVTGADLLSQAVERVRQDIVVDDGPPPPPP